jgi:predicted dehydrogenase
MIGVGIIGAGHFAAQHVRAMQAFDRLRLVCVASEDAASTARFAATHGGRACASWQEVLEDREVDVVLVTTPHHLHASMAIAAARAGKHVLVEKPMATSLADCAAMAEAAAKAGTKLLPGQLMRFVRPCRAAREVLDCGVLGRPLAGRSVMVKHWMESNRKPWHLAPASGGGMLFTAGIHALDRLIWLMDDQVLGVSSLSGTLFHEQQVPDSDMVSLRFAGGGMANLTSIGFRDTTMVDETDIICEGGLLRIDMQGGVQIGQGRHWRHVEHSSEADWPLRGLEREWKAMIDAIIDDVALPVLPWAAGEVVACITAALEAAAKRVEVAVPNWPQRLHA